MAKLCDFNLSLVDPPPLVRGGKGSRGYASPEISSGQEFDPFAADAWSLGVLLFASMTGLLPFSNSANCPRFIGYKRRGHLHTFPCSKELGAKMVSLLCLDPEKRLFYLRNVPLLTIEEA